MPANVAFTPTPDEKLRLGNDEILRILYRVIRAFDAEIMRLHNRAGTQPAAAYLALRQEVQQISARVETT